MPARRYDALDAYRGIAAMLIVVFHAWQHASPTRSLYAGTLAYPLLRGLEAGVAWFFVLSGFLLFLPFARACLDGAPPPSARSFWVKRALRILPAYYAAFLLVWSLRFAHQSTQWIDLAEHLTFTHVYDRTRIFWTIGPAWSLGDEALYYALLPLAAIALARACARLRSRRARVALLSAATLALAAASWAWRYDAAFVRHAPLDDWPTYFGFLARADAFAWGMLLAVMVAAGRGADGARLPRGASWAARAGGLAAILAAVLWRDAAGWTNVHFHGLSAAGFAILLAPSVLTRAHEAAGAWDRALASAPLRWLGLVSYSAYLWHEPLLIELAKRGWLLREGAESFLPNAILLVAITLLVATASYHLLEAPAMRLKARLARPRARGRAAARAPAP